MVLETKTDLIRKTTVTSGFNINYKHCLIRRRTEQERNENLLVLQHTRDKIKYTKQVGTFRLIQKEDSYNGLTVVKLPVNISPTLEQFS